MQRYVFRPDMSAYLERSISCVASKPHCEISTNSYFQKILYLLEVQ